MRFATGVPGVNLYPPIAAPWESAMGSEHFVAMIELWTSERPSFLGRYGSFDGIAFEPKPRRAPHPPIIVGRNSEAAIRRAARHDGWFPWLITADDLPACLDRLRAQPGSTDGPGRSRWCCRSLRSPSTRTTGR